MHNRKTVIKSFAWSGRLNLHESNSDNLLREIRQAISPHVKNISRNVEEHFIADVRGLKGRIFLADQTHHFSLRVVSRILVLLRGMSTHVQ